MWSDSLFPIPEYINEFELRHFCFGEGDSSGSGLGDEEVTPDEMYGTPEAPTAPDANDPNSPNAGYVGGEMPSPASFGYSRGYDPETDSLMPAFDSTRADSEFARDHLEQYERADRGIPLGLVGALLSPFTMGLSLVPSLVAMGLGKAADTALGTTHTVSNMLGLSKSELGEVPSYELSAEAMGLPAAEEATEVSEDIANPDDTNLDNDMMSLEGPSILKPEAPVSAMQQVPTAQQQQIAELLLQPQQGRPGYTRAEEEDPIYFT